MHAGILWRNLKEGDDLEDLGTDERLILNRWSCERWDRTACTGLLGSEL